MTGKKRSAPKTARNLLEVVEWNIRYWAWRRQLTLGDLASKAEVSTSSLFRVLNHTTDPTVGWLEKLATVLEVSVAELVAWDGEAFRVGIPREAWPRRKRQAGQPQRTPPPAQPDLPRREPSRRPPGVKNVRPERGSQGQPKTARRKATPRNSKK